MIQYHQTITAACYLQVNHKYSLKGSITAAHYKGPSMQHAKRVHHCCMLTTKVHHSCQHITVLLYNTELVLHSSLKLSELESVSQSVRVQLSEVRVILVPEQLVLEVFDFMFHPAPQFFLHPTQHLQKQNRASISQWWI